MFLFYYSLVQADSSDGGYLASDEALRQVSLKPQCAYLSVTDSHTAYGSAVIGSVLATSGNVAPRPQLISAAVDSHHLMDQGEHVRV